MGGCCFYKCVFGVFVDSMHVLDGFELYIT